MTGLGGGVEGEVWVGGECERIDVRDRALVIGGGGDHCGVVGAVFRRWDEGGDLRAFAPCAYACLQCGVGGDAAGKYERIVAFALECGCDARHQDVEHRGLERCGDVGFVSRRGLAVIPENSAPRF